MKRGKIWIVIAILVVLVGAGLYYFNRTPLSPPGHETLTSGGITVSVSYSRPSVRGRLIFGPKEQEALQPFGEYWRLGANDPTEIIFNRDILFNGSRLSGGTYRMYAIPGEGSFEIAVNTELGGWGFSEPDAAKDILRTKVTTEKTSSPVEQFTISLSPAGEGINMIFEWSDTRFIVPILAQ